MQNYCAENSTPENKKKLNTALNKIKYDLSQFTFADGIKYGVHLLIYTDQKDKVHSKYALLFKQDFSTSEAVLFQRLCCSVGKEFIVAQDSKEKDSSDLKYLRIKRFF